MTATETNTDTRADADSGRASARPVSGRDLEAIVRNHAFRAVFQPIVHLGTDAVVGYEGLSRFDDGVGTERIFSAVAEEDAKLELEHATLTCVLQAATLLPTTAYLAVNVSPTLLRDERRSCLTRTNRSLVVEISEHEPVDDYDALIGQLEDLGPHVRIAVDDVGAGYSSLRHLLRINPDVVKIDRELVLGIGCDRRRQALLTGLVHFADEAGADLVAEGIERQDDVECLRDLGVGFGQGFALGRPLPHELDLTSGR